MHYAAIKMPDIANGTGVRVSLFVSGCRNRCPGCFQPETWSFDYGEPYTEATEKVLLDALSQSYINGLTLLGGDPFEPENQIALVGLLRKMKKELPEKTAWAYSGYTLEELCDQNSAQHTDVTDEILSYLDVLVDGRFVEALYDISLRFRGSSNQRLIDMKKTRENGKICLWDDKKA